MENVRETREVAGTSDACGQLQYVFGEHVDTGEARCAPGQHHTRGEDVQLKGFGRFQVVTRARRKAYDFKEKQTIDLPPSRRAVFTPYQRLTDAIKENTDV